MPLSPAFKGPEKAALCPPSLPSSLTDYMEVQSSQRTQVSPERGLLLVGRTAPLESLGVWDDREPRMAWMVPTAEKSLAMGHGVRGLALHRAQDTEELELHCYRPFKA